MDQDEAFRRIWRTFRSTKHVSDGRHDTDAWRSHEGVYAFCCVRVPADRLQPDLDRLRRSIAAIPFVRVHPDGFLHVMLQELGFVCEDPDRRDEITPTRLEEFATAAESVGDHAPFTMSLGGANSFQDAPFLDVRDGGRCAKLHHRLHELAAVTTRARFAYLPHVTVGHYVGEASVGPLPAILADWRDHTFGSFPVTQVEIVSMNLDAPYPPLEPYAVIPLTG